MRFFSSATEPAYLDFRSSRNGSDDRENARRETGGDPGKFKLNHVMIVQETAAQVAQCLHGQRHSIEYAKVLSGAYRLRKRAIPGIVKAVKKEGVIPYIGGGATEQAIRSGTLAQYVRELHKLDIDTIEVSNGSGDLPACDEKATIRSLGKDFRRVLVEIGTKDSGGSRSRDEWRRELDAALDVDAAAIILEGAGSGRAGIYDSASRPNHLLVGDLIERAGVRKDRFLVEAPDQAQREFWVNEMFGWDVRLGNIPLDTAALKATDRLRLDAMKPGAAAELERRRGLHETFRHAVLTLAREESVDPDRAYFTESLNGVPADYVRDTPDWYPRLREHIRGMRQSTQGRVIRIIGGTGIQIISMGGGIRLEDILRGTGGLRIEDILEMFGGDFDDEEPE